MTSVKYTEYFLVISAGCVQARAATPQLSTIRDHTGSGVGHNPDDDENNDPDDVKDEDEQQQKQKVPLHFC